MEKARFLGALVGLACGDALGTTVEFKSPGSFIPVRDMVGGGVFQLKAGAWTDDTSMALCLAESLIQRRALDPVDQLTRYLRWYRDGYLSSTGVCFDIGNTVRAALHRFERTGNAFSGSTNANTAGNGSLMRLAPVPMFFCNAPREALPAAADSSRTTHGAREAVDACRYLCGLLIGALRGEDRETLLAPMYEPEPGIWHEEPLAPKIEAVARGSYKLKAPPDIRGAGYVVASLEAALWAFYHGDSFESGCLAAANLGEDADTTAAIYGQLAGAFYGHTQIPSSWRAKLVMGETIEQYAEALFSLAQKRAA
ncbi:ADP-ribosylglycohydrolase family protein [Acanthopleuribacter pedis]|uniref:ADP-ribosylglycohydrolase family protein n=1 Tax=Acanthopleuribacter pedis TaxID=442870 RepID=A0A8J7Q299_9BACT|nr:ADP-ribosylglycohydrolase family protein [Acanthopleuribacter pedis]MBO1316977.1 ADP-ribosylglycohydrolase family protein [Acanthopleuribacter pedis]